MSGGVAVGEFVGREVLAIDRWRDRGVRRR